MNEQPELDMPRAATGALAWGGERDGYHTKSDCGRYSVCRLTVSTCNVIHFIAWRLGKPFATEIGSVHLPLTATTQERAEAIAAMKQLCTGHASAQKVAA